MMRRLAVGLVLLSCVSCGHGSGGADNRRETAADSPATESTTTESSAQATAASSLLLRQLSPQEACDRFRTLAKADCSWTQRFPPEFANGSTCETSLAVWLDPATPEHAALGPAVTCWSLDCLAAEKCMVELRKKSPPPPPRACGDRGNAAIQVDANAWANRRGANAVRFSELSTTVAEPVEVCGIEGEVEWMSRVTCDDGSHPYESAAAVNSSRDAWLEHGGRCNSVLDRYSVRCPEATYTIHVDRYVCPTTL